MANHVTLLLPMMMLERNVLNITTFLHKKQWNVRTRLRHDTENNR